MVTVFDMTTGRLIYQSRDVDPTPTPHSRTLHELPQPALQTVPIESGKLLTGVPPEVALVCPDELFNRWEK